MSCPFAVAGQAILNRQNDLRNDLQIAVHEHVERVRDHAFGGVLDRHHAVVRAFLADLGEHVGNGFLRGVAQAGAEPADGGLMRERGLRAEVGDGHRLLQRQRAGHDLAVNRAQLLVGHRSLVETADAVEDGAFAVRRVNLLAGLELDVADGQPVTRALVEQPHDLLVQPVNHLAMFGNVHNRGRMQN
jgi:hypothetical protein